MRKWRPGHKSLYVIPKINGAFSSLKIIANRILPLRFSIGQEDCLVFLGDYIDKGNESDLVLDFLISIKDEPNIFTIKGNHEEMFLKAFESEAGFKYWMNSGGAATLVSYLKRNNLSVEDPFNFPRTRLRDIVPESHLDFIRHLPVRLDLEDYSFIHAGFNYATSLDETSDTSILFDDSIGKLIKNYTKKGQPLKINSKSIVVASHNPGGKSPCIHPRYMMLDAGAPQRLIVMDLNEMVCGMVKIGKSRIYDHKFEVLE